MAMPYIFKVKFLFRKDLQDDSSFKSINQRVSARKCQWDVHRDVSRANSFPSSACQPKTSAMSKARMKAWWRYISGILLLTRKACTFNLKCHTAGLNQIIYSSLDFRFRGRWLWPQSKRLVQTTGSAINLWATISGRCPIRFPVSVEYWVMMKWSLAKKTLQNPGCLIPRGYES